VTEEKVIQFVNPAEDNSHRLEPSTCIEAETFALQVRDDSMEPEFKQGCIIVVDPTGHAKEGSFVLVALPESEEQNQEAEPEELVKSFLFRQLRRQSEGGWVISPLNSAYSSEVISDDLKDVVGVVVQRAGTRRRYHKHYD